MIPELHVGVCLEKASRGFPPCDVQRNSLFVSVIQTASASLLKVSGFNTPHSHSDSEQTSIFKFVSAHQLVVSWTRCRRKLPERSGRPKRDPLVALSYDQSLLVETVWTPFRLGQSGGALKQQNGSIRPEGPQPQ